MRVRQSALGDRRCFALRAAPLTARAWLGAWRLRKHAWTRAAAKPLSVLERPHVGPPPSRYMWIARSTLPRRRCHCHHRLSRL
ncbi:unnamed protein product, partial [Brenthis ino]